MLRRLITSFLVFPLLITPIYAQGPRTWTTGEINEAIQKLNVLGSVLYVAAHPDDENTSMIAYMANELKMNTAYLSLTRGDGGQNLIGTEIQELLGVIRTQELLAARQIDGGNQLFSRANDFGYSKHPDETLTVWNKDEVLADVVWAIRKWQPDIIINRFDHNSAGKTHGHHTSSAILSYDAFDLAGNPDYYPSQLDHVKPWQPKRLFFNTSWWFYGSREKFEEADKSNLLTIDVGVYYPDKGKSNSEIAAASRSMHRCQGMGRAGTRGEQIEYLQFLKGDLPKSSSDPFDGIDVSWNRIKGGKPIGNLLNQVEANFDFHHPYKSIPNLMKAYQLIRALPDGYWKQVKQKEIEQVIEACMGLFVEVTAADFSATPGETVPLNIEIINRSNVKAALKSYMIQPSLKDSLVQLPLNNNKGLQLKESLVLPQSMEISNPYWLNKKGTTGMYSVPDQRLRGLPETPRQVSVLFNFTVDNIPFSIIKNVIYKKTDPVKAEIYRPFEITPPVYSNIQEKVYVFADNKPKKVNILIKSGKESLKGKITLCHPENWKIEPDSLNFSLDIKGQEQLVSFNLFPPEKQEEGQIIPLITLEDGSEHTKGVTYIEYDHIPTQTIVKNYDSRVVRIDLKKEGENIGYIMGAGDEIPSSLEQIGYKVHQLEDAEIISGNLEKYDAIILGVRAYNTVDRLKFYQPKLLEYVEKGGTMIVQYNTTWRLKIDKNQIAPYKMNISRDRVAVETAEMRMLVPEHPILNHPNKITEADFSNWIQERGLYFANEWDQDKFTAILSSNDPGETPKNGGLLVAKHGEGHYIYSGYSWFRELPAGIPGAYRLFTNMISIGKNNKP